MSNGLQLSQTPHRKSFTKFLSPPSPPVSACTSQCYIKWHSSLASIFAIHQTVPSLQTFGRALNSFSKKNPSANKYLGCKSGPQRLYASEVLPLLSNAESPAIGRKHALAGIACTPTALVPSANIIKAGHCSQHYLNLRDYELELVAGHHEAGRDIGRSVVEETS